MIPFSHVLLSGGILERLQGILHTVSIEPDVISCLLDLATIWALGMATYLVIEGNIQDMERKNAQ